jgi:hypothetical protein
MRVSGRKSQDSEYAAPSGEGLMDPGTLDMKYAGMTKVAGWPAAVIYSSTSALESKWCRLWSLPEVILDTCGREDQMRWGTEAERHALVRFLPCWTSWSKEAWGVLEGNGCGEGKGEKDFFPVVCYAEDGGGAGDGGGDGGLGVEVGLLVS